MDDFRVCIGDSYGPACYFKAGQVIDIVTHINDVPCLDVFLLEDIAHHAPLFVQGDPMDRLHAHLARPRFDHAIRLRGEDHHFDAGSVQLLDTDAVTAISSHGLRSILVHPDSIICDHTIEITQDQLNLLRHGTPAA